MPGERCRVGGRLAESSLLVTDHGGQRFQTGAATMGKVTGHAQHGRQYVPLSGSARSVITVVS